MDFTSSYASATLDDIRAWHSTLPPSFCEKQLQGFYLEFLYSQALALSPNQVVPVTSIKDSHKTMFFQCAIQFSEQLRSMIQNQELQACLCYADFCRARYISRQFQTIVWASFDLLVRGGQTTGAPISPTSPLGNCNGALLFLRNMSSILEWPKQRWRIGALQETFEQESAVLLARLTTLQQEYTTSQVSATTAFASQHQPNVSPGSRAALQHMDMSQPPQMNFSIPHDYDSRYRYAADSANDAAPYSNPATHRSNLLRASKWPSDNDQGNPELPPGSLPRRSYQFNGGQR